ncbi:MULTISPECIES: haloacid dehalogenase type II [unclassified Thermoactinomyces]|uniref:haloacid dehalogenase type II n=1 Tax=unclassified Thermoactinomyces TaxID=2634588 RepID=UPI0018DC8B89|nr:MULTISPECIES: haloacid dehalogenase type II [unclassified Thermoactinomyces]MBH8599627.1 haloacid dehalogenase type II [Thermoactinomyces sp. CICC 10523]MBH8605741.1 haloacid dehalogenase type II [Thermoactinomyces sp. CICC 10522]
MGKKNVKVIVFDAYGTLFDVHSVIQKCEELFPTRGQQISELWRTKQLEYAFIQHIIGRYRPFDEITKNSLRFACEQLGVALAENQEKELLRSYLTLSPYEEVPNALKKLANRYQLAILTNGTLNMIQPLVEYHHLNPYFSELMSVDGVKQYKPSPAAYAYALDRLQCEREDILFLSSNTWDITGASSFGFQTAWVNRKKVVFDRMGQQPDHIIYNLNELIRIV